MNPINLVSGIYKITNKANNKVYIGASLNIGMRFTAHLVKLRNGYHDNKELQQDFNQYGQDAFIFEIIEEVPDTDDELIHEREKYWINHFPSVYNSGYRLGTGKHCRSIDRYGVKIELLERVTIDSVEYVTLNELARYFGITIFSVRAWLVTGAFPNRITYKRRVFIPVSDLIPYSLNPKKVGYYNIPLE